MRLATNAILVLAIFGASASWCRAGGDKDVKLLVERLKDKDDAVRLETIKALASKAQAAQPALPALLDLLKQPDPSRTVHPAVYRAVERIGVDPALLPTLLADLKGKELAPATIAARVLGLMGTPAVPALVASLKDPNPVVRARSASALFHVRELPESVVPALIERLDDPAPYVRGFASSVLNKMGSRAQAAVPALIKAVKAKNVLAAGALGGIGVGSADAVAVLREALKDTTTSVKVNTFSTSDVGKMELREMSLAEAAASALARLGPETAAVATPDLMQALRDKRAAVRMSAAYALAQFGPDAKEAAGALVSLLRERDQLPMVQAAAAGALGMLGPAAGPPLREALKDKSRIVRALSAAALGKVRPPSKDNVAGLKRVLLDADPFVRAAAARALGEIGAAASDAAPSLSAALRKKDQPPNVLKEMVTALAKLGRPGANALVAALKVPNPVVRRLAVTALDETRPVPSGAVAALKTALADNDGEVRALAAGAIGGMGSEAKTALPLLQWRARNDPIERVRQAAAAAATATKK